MFYLFTILSMLTNKYKKKYVADTDGVKVQIEREKKRDYFVMNEPERKLFQS